LTNKLACLSLSNNCTYRLLSIPNLQFYVISYVIYYHQIQRPLDEKVRV
jgi:hypothetical protein